LTPLKAIRKYCLGCAGSVSGVRRCEDDNCTLHFYRLGKNPNRAGIGSICNINSEKKIAHSTNDFETQDTSPM